MSQTMLKAVFCLLVFGTALAAPNFKIDSDLVKTLRSHRTADIIVKFGNENVNIFRDLASLKFSTKTEKRIHLVTALKVAARKSQSSAVSILQSPQFANSEVQFKQLWISNEMSIKNAPEQLIEELSNLPEVSKIKNTGVIYLRDVDSDNSASSVQTDWNLDKIEAPAAWNLTGGNRGQGVVVASIDAGVRYTHEALRNNFRPDYGWFDPYDGTTVPDDSGGRTGTPVMGTIVSVAPEAEWVACRGCKHVISIWACWELEVKQCGQWMLCPTHSNGSNEDCSKAPDVVSNTFTASETTRNFNIDFEDVISAWKAADIIPVFAIGNTGPACMHTHPPADHDNVIGVGATTSTDDIAMFSSKGPSLLGVTKPDITAPGHAIWTSSADSDTSYNAKFGFGTQLAAAHVTGTVALLLSRDRRLSYNQIKDILLQNTDRNLGEGTECGNVPPTQFPNNVFGHGRLNARKALQAAIDRNTSRT